MAIDHGGHGGKSEKTPPDRRKPESGSFVKNGARASCPRSIQSLYPE
jgi:hypothetical protein